jgi:putative transcriptional regulator
MPIVVNLDVMLAKRKMRSRDLVPLVGITEQNISLLRSGKIKGVRFDTLERICAALNCQPGIYSNMCLTQKRQALIPSKVRRTLKRFSFTNNLRT